MLILALCFFLSSIAKQSGDDAAVLFLKARNFEHGRLRLRNMVLSH